MGTNRPDTVNPPYISGGEFHRFLEIVSKVRFDHIDTKKLQIQGFGVGSSGVLLSALRYLKIIDDNGKVTDPKLLIRLGSPQERQAALREITDRAYADLISQKALNEATVENVTLYFKLHDVTPSLASKAARFFMWIAQESGYELGEKFRIAPRRERPANSQRDTSKLPVRNGKNAEPESQLDEEEDEEESVADGFQEELIRILLDNMKASKQLPPTDLLKEITNLINSMKGGRSDDSS